MQTEIKKIFEQVAKLEERLKEKEQENYFLRQKIQFLLQKMFGKKTEKIDPNQLQLLLMNIDPTTTPEDDPPDPKGPPKKRAKRTPRKDKLPHDLPVEEVVLKPKAVLDNPQNYRCIGKEVTEELDLSPAKFFKRRIIRFKYVEIENRESPPIICKAPKRLIDGGFASVGLLVHIILNKYVDHLPLYRQEKIFKSRYGIDLSRKTMSDWMFKIGNWLRLIYHEMKEEIRATGYLQIDESPIRYLNPGMGKCSLGYLWAFHAPGIGVVYEWHTTRSSSCLEEMLSSFQGTIQADGFSAYTSFVKDKDYLELISCWAHVRRMFFEAKDETPFAAWILLQIQHLYRIEKEIKEQNFSHTLREVRRESESQMIVNRICKALKMKMGAYRPRSLTGKAVNYSLKRLHELTPFLHNGRLEIDNNLVENAFRPPALGKKNWMFFGSEESGWQSAVIYSIVESCKKLNINPKDYLTDILNRLPELNNQQIKNLTPTKWYADQVKKSA